MDIDITCFEASDYISASIDGELDPDLAEKLNAHLRRCRICSFEHILDSGTKSAVRRHLKSVTVPSHLRESILGSLRKEGAKTAARPSRFPGLFSFTTWRMPVAFAGAVAIALVAMLFLNKKPTHNHTRPSDGNIVTEAFNNFDEVIDGTMKPEIVSTDHDEIMSYLKQKANFSVSVPTMSGFRLVGAGVSSADRETSAHVMYERDGEYVYVRQVNFKSLLTGGKHYIPPATLAELQRSGWAFAGNDSDCTLAMWLEDSTLCMAVGDMRRDLLVSNLTGGAR